MVTTGDKQFGNQIDIDKCEYMMRQRPHCKAANPRPRSCRGKFWRTQQNDLPPWIIVRAAIGSLIGAARQRAAG